MSSYLNSLSAKKSRTQFAQNPYKSLLDSGTTVLVRKNTITGNNIKKDIRKKSTMVNKTSQKQTTNL